MLRFLLFSCFFLMFDSCIIQERISPNSLFKVHDTIGPLTKLYSSIIIHLESDRNNHLKIIFQQQKNKPLTTTTLNDLCRILNCRLEEIAQYIPSDEDQVL